MKVNKFAKLWYMLLLLPLVFVTSCGDDDTPPPPITTDPVASFQFEVDADDFLKVNFTNYSKNATSYAWNFGDNAGTSTEESPSYTYTASGTYTVSLTATNAAGTSATKEESVTITDPAEAIKLITGEVSKIWKLYREGTSMSVGSDEDNPGNQWSGLTNNGTRNCLYEQTITFGADSSYVFDDKGMFWAEYGLFNNVGGCDQNVMDETCFDPSGILTNACGTDISAFLSGTHKFTYEASTGEMTLNGLGAWIVIPKLGTTAERLEPEGTTSFKVSIEEKTGHDVMKVEFVYSANYWVAYYASYSDPSLEPSLTTINADFSVSTSGLTATFTNESSGASSYSWDFGDGNSSTDESPTHDYAAEGTYTVTLTASEGSDSETVTKEVIIDAVIPGTAAPIPSEDAADVISIYSDTYTSIDGVNTNPNWGQQTVVTEMDVAGDNVLKLTGLNYQGIDWTSIVGSVDVSTKRYIHVDIWSEDATELRLFLIGGGAEHPIKITTVAGMWKSSDLELTDYSANGVDLTQTIQLKFDDNESGSRPSIFVDNLYFY